METPNILVIDSDPKNLLILKESLESSNFKVTTINNGIDAWGIIQSQKPDLIVCEVDVPGLNGFEIYEKLQNHSAGASIPVVFLTNRRNLEDRIKSLRSGVKDYMIKPLHVKEVIARIRMILRRLERVQNEEPELSRNVVGRLEEQSVEDLVECYGAERRTGVLAIYDNNNLNGEIYFRDGSVINARLGNFKAEKAVYQMLPWKHGHFVMTFQDINVEDEITVSNLGLLLQGFKRLQEREQLIKQLPSFDTIFVKTAIFEQILKKKSISTDAMKLIALFDGKRSVSNIISESIYDDIKTLEKINKLYQQGFIRPLGSRDDEKFSSDAYSTPPLNFHPMAKQEEFNIHSTTPQQMNANNQTLPADEAFGLKVSSKFQNEKELESQTNRENEMTTLESEIARYHLNKEHNTTQQTLSDNGNAVNEKAPQPIESQVDFTQICNHLFNGHTFSRGQLVIISSESQYRKELISTMTNDHFATKPMHSNVSESIELGKIVTAKRYSLEIIGLSIERKFLQMLDQISPTLVGYIVLVIADQSKQMDYLGYLINSLKQKFTIPHIVAVYHPSVNKLMPLDIVRYSLRMDAKDQLVEIDIKNIDSIKNLLEQLKAPEYS